MGRSFYRTSGEVFTERCPEVLFVNLTPILCGSFPGSYLSGLGV
jgi:hypothetical protein